jgi:hypothetical protein
MADSANHHAIPLAKVITTRDCFVDIEAMRRQAWREQGIICLRIQDIPDAEIRASLNSWAESKWGKR